MLYTKVLLVVFLMLIVNFFNNFFNIVDPDYFWHYKAGEYIAENKVVPEHDLFSFTMPSFAWVDHEWLSDTILYTIEKNVGEVSLSFFYLLLFGGVIFFSLNKNKLNIIDGVIAIVGVGAIAGYLGVRQQMYSFLFFAITLFILKLKDEKFLWFLPIAFLAWANLHGGFVIGLFALAVIFGEKIYRLIREKQKPYKLIAIFSLSFLATLANPYGTRIYEEVFRTVGDNYLSSHIREWLPFFDFIQARFLIFIAIFLSFLPEIKKRISFGHLILLVVLFALSLKSVKYIPFFVIASIPSLLDLTSVYLDEAHKKFYRKVVLKPAFYPIVAASFLVLFFFVFPGSISKEGVAIKYPDKAVPFLEKRTEKNVFAFYGWAGFLIKNLPEKKYFIDGRMPSWKQGQVYAFRDYIDATACKRTEEILKENNVGLIVWPAREEKTSGVISIKNIFDHFQKKSNERECSFKEEISKNSWKIIYNDGDTLVFKK